MKKTKRTMRFFVGLLTAMLLAMALAGCGSKGKTDEELKEGMTEFKSPDETCSIYMNKEWKTEEVGVDNWLLAMNNLESQGIIVMQLPKATYGSSVSDMDELAAFVEDTYSISGKESADAPSIEGLTSISSYNCEMDFEGTHVDAIVLYGETEYAYYAIAGVSDKMSDTFRQAFRVSCGTLKENAPEVESLSNVELTDTIRWFNGTYALLTSINSWDYNFLGGLPATEANKPVVQGMLEEWWDVYDRASADETLTWILDEGHRTDFAENMTILVDAGLGDVAAEERMTFVLDNFDVTEEEAQWYLDMFGFYEEFGPGAIDGWDYSRAISLVGYYYVAGYYTEQEALDKSLEIAGVLQPIFTSWDEFMDSYLRGYEYWAEESSDERRGIYEELKKEADSPFSLDWNLPLEKTW